MGWFSKLGNVASAALFGYEISDKSKNEVQIVTVTVKPIYATDHIQPMFDTSELVLFCIIAIMFLVGIAIVISMLRKRKSSPVAASVNARLNV